MDHGGGNFFTSLRPIYLFNKILGLIPFTLNASNEIVVHWWDVAYAGAVVATTFVNAILKAITGTLLYEKVFELSYIVSEHLTTQLIFLTILLSSFISGKSIRNLRILYGKIIFSEYLIYNTKKLQDISRRNCLVAILSIVMAFGMEIIFTIFYILETNSPNVAPKYFIFTMTWVCEIINTSILMQLLFWFWLFNQRFNEIKFKLIASFKDCNIIKNGIQSIRIELGNR